MNLFKYIVDTILAFAKAFNVSQDAACDWLCDYDPRLATTIARARRSRETARERVTTDPTPPLTIDGESEIAESVE